MKYDANFMGDKNIPDTMVLLEEVNSEKTFCVTSAHFRGFSLANIEEDKAGWGDNQVRYDLNTMEAANADYCLIAGDYNVTEKHYRKRLNILELDYEYDTARTPHGPTIYDRNLKTWSGIAMKATLDHAHGKGAAHDLTVESIETIGTPDTEETSDHCAILVTYSIEAEEDTVRSNEFSNSEDNEDD
jgi:endonuclease/exonuclease/phosphatase family metal-dependent hydrolase